MHKAIAISVDLPLPAKLTSGVPASLREARGSKPNKARKRAMARTETPPPMPVTDFGKPACSSISRSFLCEPVQERARR